MHENTRGALLMVASMACFVANDSCLKLIGDAMSLQQLLLMRGTLTIILMFILAAMLGQLNFRMSGKDWAWGNLRGIAEVFAAYFFLTALFNMPLANLTAVMQALPLAITMAGAVFLRERVGWRRWSAILIGFVGVMFIVQPGGSGFNSYSIYGLLAVAFVTLRDMCARPLSKEVPSMVIAIIGAVGVTVAAGLVLLWDTSAWKPVAMREAVLMVMASFFLLGGYYFSVAVMRVGEVSFTAPFRYTGLIWALVVGWYLWGDWPDVLTWIGICIVVASGGFAFYRERVVTQPDFDGKMK
ncbi:DMT family transporter [Halocynthiibacter namhaensis]|uniref:DMT family transporter n=1 Tax=Halocynthiibacter namhaensis TaxID=1290553 RepID=UPI00057969DF|nr:DMT family transporter [Halocynthiibacter namhaensis]